MFNVINQRSVFVWKARQAFCQAYEDVHLAYRERNTLSEFRVYLFGPFNFVYRLYSSEIMNCAIYYYIRPFRVRWLGRAQFWVKPRPQDAPSRQRDDSPVTA